MKPDRIDTLTATVDQLQSELEDLSRRNDALASALLGVLCLIVAGALLSRQGAASA